MREVVGVKDKILNQISYIFTNENYAIGDMLIVENGRGEYLLKCASTKVKYNELRHKILESNSVRLATSDEILTYIDNQNEITKFKDVFNSMLKELHVNAILYGVEISLDNKHIKYTYFSTEKLVFQKLISYLLKNNPRRMKIEFLQVGEREYYALNGGVGVCGYELCCHSRGYSTPVITTNTLRSLGVNINFKKTITGSCSKYKCCLLFDVDKKEDLKQKLPDVNDLIVYNQKTVKVIDVDLSKNKVIVDDGNINEISFEYFMRGKNEGN